MNLLDYAIAVVPVLVVARVAFLWGRSTSIVDDAPYEREHEHEHCHLIRVRLAPEAARELAMGLTRASVDCEMAGDGDKVLITVDMDAQRFIVTQST